MDTTKEVKAKQNNFKTITAWVSVNNIPSIKIMEKNGFRKNSEHETRKLPQVDRSDTFYLWSMAL